MSPGFRPPHLLEVLCSCVDRLFSPRALSFSDLSRLISAGRLNCTIDKVNGVVETNRRDKKNAQYEQVVKQGDLLLNCSLPPLSPRSLPASRLTDLRSCRLAIAAALSKLSKVIV